MDAPVDVLKAAMLVFPPGSAAFEPPTGAGDVVL
jgi:hypothetical protein